MATIEYELIIKANTQFVYDVSQDYSVRYLWDPFPEKIKLLHGATLIKKGTKAFVLAKSGLKMEVEFIQVAPPTTAVIKMTQGPVFIDAFAGSWIFKPEAGFTKAKFIYSIKSKKWALPFIINRMAAWYFLSVVKRRLNGLKSYCESVT